MNQTLEGHSVAVKCLVRNSNLVKFATSNAKKPIIICTWQKEMINNKIQSVVKDMKWTPDDSRICIIYVDGSVIVGSVKSKRLCSLKFVEWSQNGELLLFV